MSTTSVTLNSATWTSLGTGPFTLQIQGNVPILVAFNASTPNVGDPAYEILSDDQLKTRDFDIALPAWGMCVAGYPNTKVSITSIAVSAVETMADGADVTQGTTTDAAYSGSGPGTEVSLLKWCGASLAAIYSTLTGRLLTRRSPLVYTLASGSPFTLTSTWAKVVTTTTATAGLRIAPISTATAFDIEWTSVTAGAGAPTLTYGEPIMGGEDFASGLPVGDIYLRSATGQVATVKTGA
jgi:hypothetical protein